MRSDIFASAFSRTVSFCSGDGRTTTSDVSSRRGRFFAAACSGSGDDALLPSGRSSSETSIRVLVCEDTAQLRLHDRRQSQRGSRRLHCQGRLGGRSEGKRSPPLLLRPH